MYSVYRPDDKKKDKTPGIFRVIFILAGLIAGFLLTHIFFTSYRVTSISMQPSYAPGDYIILFRLYKSETGSAVVVKSPLEEGKYYFGRIAAKGGDSVQIINKEVYINGNFYQPAVKIVSDDVRIFPEEFTERDNSPKTVVPEGQVFIMGDNIDRSFDSRFFGPVPEKSIVGKVLLNF